MEEKKVVNEEPTTPQPSEGIKPEAVNTEITPQPAPAGSKTEPELLLKSLQEEREKRRILDEELLLAREKIEELTSVIPESNETFSEEGKELNKRISSLNEKIELIEEEKNLEKMFSQFPALKEKAEEFKEFRRAEHPRAKLESVAKLYLAENGLLEPQRKGLENPSGGTRTPVSPGMSAEDVATLRKTNFKKYQQLLKEGKLKIT